tara:strand:- start:6323 stop:6583 length:261 start_codon:yes stop_codon:yes gene_type:complete
MDNENFNDNDMPNFVLPESFLNQLFEFSGSTDGNKGFILAFVNQEGSPMIYTKADNQIIEMGLRKAIERYILDSEEAESYNGNDPI